MAVQKPGLSASESSAAAEAAVSWSSDLVSAFFG
jgi:hypothetical protein